MDSNINFENEADKFLNLFKILEEVIRDECQKKGIDARNEVSIGQLINKLSEKNNIIKRHKNELDIIRDIRNILTHKSGKVYKNLITPSPEVTDNLENIIREIKNPPQIYNSPICIKKDKMYCRNLYDNIYETIKEMTNKLYTHVPIIENGKLIGVFSENTILDIVNSDGKVIIDETMKFEEIKEFIKIENHSMERFEFIAKDKNIYEVEEMFEKYFKQNKRIGCIYITDKGKKDEKIIGMLTAWDVLGN